MQNQEESSWKKSSQKVFEGLWHPDTEALTKALNWWDSRLDWSSGSPVVWAASRTVFLVQGFLTQVVHE